MSTATYIVAAQSSAKVFRPAPRFWIGNMCGVRVAGLPAVPGGAADASLVLSWFIDRYSPTDRQRIYSAWKAKGYSHVLVSWPDSHAYGRSAQQFGETCQELIDNGFYPCPFLCSKDFDPPNVAAILANIAPVLPHLVGRVPLMCIGWELSIWLTPTQVQELIDALAPQFVAYGCRCYVHFQEGYSSFQQPDQTFASFWNIQVGKLTGVLRQKILSQTPDQYRYDSGGIVDVLVRFAGNFGVVSDSGFGHPFDDVELEITAQTQFNGQITEQQGDELGQWAIDTPEQSGPAGYVRVMGSGNGYLHT